MAEQKEDRVVSALVKACKALPGAEQYVMVHHPAFRVGKKPFAVAGMQVAGRTDTVSVNLGREAQFELLSDARFQKTPYLHQHGWVTIAFDDLAPDELSALVVDSWRRIASKKQLAQRDGAAQGVRSAR
jgi:predicted DNA-binding protein (MmcQ/YjbR family)